MALIRKPKSVEQLKQLRGKATSRRRVTACDLSRIADPRSTPKAQGQWPPLDPPRSVGLGIGGLIAGNAIGLHRLRLGVVLEARFKLAPLPEARLVFEGLLGSAADSAAACGLTEDLS